MALDIQDYYNSAVLPSCITLSSQLLSLIPVEIFVTFLIRTFTDVFLQCFFLLLVVRQSIGLVYEYFIINVVGRLGERSYRLF